MSEFSCDDPGIAELMVAFEAAFGAIQPYLDVVFNPGDLGEAELIELTATLALGPGAIPVLQALAMIDVMTVVPSLPPMPAPFNVGISLEGWDPAVQGAALALTLTAMIEIPISLVIGAFEGESFVFPNAVKALLPEIPGVDGLADCISDVVRPIFSG